MLLITEAQASRFILRKRQILRQHCPGDLTVQGPKSWQNESFPTLRSSEPLSPLSQLCSENCIQIKKETPGIESELDFPESPAMFFLPFGGGRMN